MSLQSPPNILTGHGYHYMSMNKLPLHCITLIVVYTRDYTHTIKHRLLKENMEALSENDMKDYTSVCIYNKIVTYCHIYHSNHYIISWYLWIILFHIQWSLSIEILLQDPTLYFERMTLFRKFNKYCFSL